MAGVRRRMPFHAHKYWHDVLRPVLRQDTPPLIPQAVVLQQQQVLLVQRDTPRLWELPGGSLLPDETPEQQKICNIFNLAHNCAVLPKIGSIRLR